MRASCSIYTYSFRMALQEGAHPPVRNGMGSAQRAHLRKRCISLDAQLLPLSAIRHSMPVDSGYSKHVLGRIACTLASLGGRTSTWPSDCSLSHTCQTLSFGGKAQVNGTVKRSRCSHAGSDIWVQAAPKFVTTSFGQNFHRAHSNGHRVSRTPSKPAISKVWSKISKRTRWVIFLRVSQGNGWVPNVCKCDRLTH